MDVPAILISQYLVDSYEVFIPWEKYRDVDDFDDMQVFEPCERRPSWNTWLSYSGMWLKGCHN